MILKSACDCLDLIFFFFNFFMLNEENAYFEALLSYKPVWVLSITFLFSVWMYLCENVLAH